MMVFLSGLAMKLPLTMKTVVLMSKRLETMARAVPHCPAPVSVVRVWMPALAL